MEFLKDAIRRRLDEVDIQKRASNLERELHELGPDADRAAAKIRAGGPRGKFCHNCGAALSGPFCSNCGTKAG